MGSRMHNSLVLIILTWLYCVAWISKFYSDLESNECDAYWHIALGHYFYTNRKKILEWKLEHQSLMPKAHFSTSLKF